MNVKNKRNFSRNLAPETRGPIQIPPHSIHAEMGVLGSLMLDKQAWNKVVGKLAPEDFYSQAHQLIFKAMAGLVSEGKPLDVITLSETLERLGWLEESGGLAYLASLAKETPSAANIDAYMKIVQEKAGQRSLMAAGAEMLTLAADPGERDVPSLLAEFQSTLDIIAKRRKGLAPPLSGIAPEKLEAAQLHPRCIVDKYLYANLDLVAAAGGTGKTTTLIYEAICMALGRPLWGLKVWNPGATLFITAEDDEDLFCGRIREIMDAMELSPYERQKVMSRITVWDVSGDLVRLAELDQGGNIRLTGLADSIVVAYRNDPPAVIVFDPCISFGPGERIINDGEQAIVTACRRIIRALDCCVRIVHHTGKANAGASHQYASRGGTALPDGSRMVHVFASVNPKDRTEGDMPTNKPEGFELGDGESGFIIHRAKLTYEAPQPNIWVRRRGYVFEHFTETPRTRAHDAEAREREIEIDAETLLQYIRAELDAGRKHTSTSLDESAPPALGIPRARLRPARSRLIVSGRLVETELPQAARQGSRKTFLNPAAHLGGVGSETGTEPRHPTPPPTTPPPYREKEDGGVVAPPVLSLFSNSAVSGSAGFGGVGGVEDEGVPV